MIGSEVMNEIIHFCELNNINYIISHIDLTHRTESGYPDNKNIHTDPTIQFLKKFDFSVDYAPNITAKGKRKI